MDKPYGSRLLDKKAWQLLGPVRKNYRNQVVRSSPLATKLKLIVRSRPRYALMRICRQCLLDIKKQERPGIGSETFNKCVAAEASEPGVKVIQIA